MSQNQQLPLESPSTTRVLIVEDDRDLNNLLCFTLEAAGDCSAASAFESTDILERIRDLKPDLLILDVMLPGPLDGLGVLKAIRADSEVAALPVILLTAKSQEHDRIAGFESGADDYISKPFSPKELMLRVNALLRRSGIASSTAGSGSVSSASSELRRNDGNDNRMMSNEPVVIAGPIRIYPELFRVTVDEETITLTSTEYQLLSFLAERMGRLQSRSALLQKVWGYEGNVNTRTVDTHIKRLRQKLGIHGGLIETVHGFGYQLNTKLAPTTQASASATSAPEAHGGTLTGVCPEMPENKEAATAVYAKKVHKGAADEVNRVVSGDPN